MPIDHRRDIINATTPGQEPTAPQGPRGSPRNMTTDPAKLRGN
ncbi:hypothetical protein [Actinophytocola algeriensis]|uniref:Uncharacterized protein n=1 Tax=Actinophytocola algeriensis TaxID=1768010 RepID=A0A7W7Q758_9PSEU|nr:hypothetical protein [Actinophytocola algeriensis]MBB4908229.1 hypothetical protein [Actinophytocola algeriensis]MBE1480259.1 hypothetical protein [Actinophytocola algeriensis]